MCQQIRQAAQDLGIPMYCLKSSAPAQLARALQTFLTFQPAEAMEDAADAPDVRSPKYDCDFDVADYIPGQILTLDGGSCAALSFVAPLIFLGQ